VRSSAVPEKTEKKIGASKKTSLQKESEQSKTQSREQSETKVSKAKLK
jgi:hypothetical protein